MATSLSCAALTFAALMNAFASFRQRSQMITIREGIGSRRRMTGGAPTAELHQHRRHVRPDDS
jgi:hypothetical protein